MEPTTTPAGRSGVTFEQVAAIADAIAAQGHRPTLRGVRAELGTGSMGTIQKHLTAWQGTRRAIVTSSATLPTEIQRVILSEIERAVSEARAELEADLAATKGALAELADDNEAQAAQIEHQAAQVAEGAALGQQQIGRIVQLEAGLAATADEIKRERDEAANGRQALARAELRLEQLPLLHAEAERLRVALDAASARAAAAEQNAAVGAAQLEGLRAQVEELRQMRARLESERDQARDQASQAQGQAREQARQIEQQTAELAILRGLAAGIPAIREHTAPPVADAPQLTLELQQPDPAPEPAPAPKKTPAKRRTPPPPAA